jgi:hypothetical protein
VREEGGVRNFEQNNYAREEKLLRIGIEGKALGYVF